MVLSLLRSDGDGKGMSCILTSLSLFPSPATYEIDPGLLLHGAELSSASNPFFFFFCDLKTPF